MSLPLVASACPLVALLSDPGEIYTDRSSPYFLSPSCLYLCSDKSQVEWVKAFIGALEELRKYIMQFHTTALTWNSKVRLRLAPVISAKASS